MTQTQGVAIVEDDVLTRQHFEDALQSAAAYRCLWSAANLATARRQLRHWPHLVLLDLGLPDGDGAEFVDTLRTFAQQRQLTLPKVLVVTIFDDRRSVLRAVQSGADGYLLKHSDSAAIVQALDELRDGGAPLSPRASVHLTQALRQQSTLPRAATPSLTAREQDVLGLLAKGLSYRATGAELGISLHTVGDFVKSIYRKLGVNSRSEAVYRGVQEQIIRLE